MPAREEAPVPGHRGGERAGTIAAPRPMRLTVTHLKVVHTAIFVVLSACVLYVLASGALGRIDHWTWIALVAIRVLGGGQ